MACFDFQIVICLLELEDVGYGVEAQVVMLILKVLGLGNFWSGRFCVVVLLVRRSCTIGSDSLLGRRVLYY